MGIYTGWGYVLDGDIYWVGIYTVCIPYSLRELFVYLVLFVGSFGERFSLFGDTQVGLLLSCASIPIGLFDSMRQGHMAVECVLGGGVNLN